MSDMIFKDNSGQYCVCLSRDICRQLIEQCINAHQKETGGILVGEYSENQTIAQITSLIPPPRNSVFLKNGFFRGTKGVINILDDAWNKCLYYVGEWHYHPDAMPIPSDQDKKQMIQLSRYTQLHCPEPILIIVGGNKGAWKINVMVFVDDNMKVLSKSTKREGLIMD